MLCPRSTPGLGFDNESECVWSFPDFFWLGAILVYFSLNDSSTCITPSSLSRPLMVPLRFPASSWLILHSLVNWMSAVFLKIFSISNMMTSTTRPFSSFVKGDFSTLELYSGKFLLPILNTIAWTLQSHTFWQAWIVDVDTELWVHTCPCFFQLSDSAHDCATLTFICTALVPWARFGVNQSNKELWQSRMNSSKHKVHLWNMYYWTRILYLAYNCCYYGESKSPKPARAGSTPRRLSSSTQGWMAPALKVMKNVSRYTCQGEEDCIPSNEGGELTAIYSWTSWVWEITVEVQDFRKITHHFRGMCRIYLKILKKNCRSQHVTS